MFLEKVRSSQSGKKTEGKEVGEALLINGSENDSEGGPTAECFHRRKKRGEQETHRLGCEYQKKKKRGHSEGRRNQKRSDRPSHHKQDSKKKKKTD